MRRWLLCCLIAGAFLFAAAGCGRLNDYREIFRDRGVSGEYLAALDRWSRAQIVYSQLETRAHIRATYLSPEFDRAYRKEYANIYPGAAGERNGEGEVRGGAADFTEFTCYAYIPEKSSNDFDRQGSIWSIFLIDGAGQRIAPVEVRRIEPVTPVITAFFPYINPYYGNAYRLRFPPLSGSARAAGPLRLVFASVIARVDLEFRAQ